MLRYYRNHFLENTKHGSAYKISTANETIRLRQIRAEKKTRTVAIQTEPVEPEKPKKQTHFRIFKRMTTTETQTEEMNPLEISDTDSSEEFEGGIYQNFLSMRTRTCSYLRFE